MCRCDNAVFAGNLHHLATHMKDTHVYWLPANGVCVCGEKKRRKRGERVT